MRIAPSQANGKVRAHAVVCAERHTAGREIKARHIAGTVDIGELAKPGHPDAPAVVGSGLHHRRAALAFWPGWSRKALGKVRPSAVNRKAARAESTAPLGRITNVFHAAPQIDALNICQGNTNIENCRQLLGRNQFQITTDFGKWLRVEEDDQPRCTRITHGPVKGSTYRYGVGVAGNLSERPLRPFELD